MRSPTDDDNTARWARSGAMWLTGRADAQPLGPPAHLVDRLSRVAEVIRRRSAMLGREVDVDPLAMLGERAAIAGFGRAGTTSCGGGSRLLPAADGWVAVSLPRADAIDAVPAWLEIEASAAVDPWPAIAAAIASRPREAVVARAALLGLAVAALPLEPLEPHLAPPPISPLPLRATKVGEAPPARSSADVTVVDLTALWAGPLCTQLLAGAGASVIKVESATRPDGARAGPAAFFDLLNGGKRSVALDLTRPDGIAVLRKLISHATVVVEATRPRALEQLGVDAARSLRGDDGPRVWVSITGYGRGHDRDRIAFGDDAAVGGGLVARDGRGPCFCADAVADPLTGMVAAAACLDALAVDGRWMLDISMAGVAAHHAGPTLTANGRADEPRARPVVSPAARLGADTAAVLASFGIS